MIRGTGPSELGWSQPISKNPIERAWTQWVQRRLSNRREQILHFDLSRKGREAILSIQSMTSPYSHCPYTFHLSITDAVFYCFAQLQYFPAWFIRDWYFERKSTGWFAENTQSFFVDMKRLAYALSLNQYFLNETWHKKSNEIDVFEWKFSSFFSYIHWWKMLLWQVCVATSPHNFVIATCIWSELIIYLLVKL